MSILYARDITHIQHSLNLCLYQNETSALTHFDVPNGLVPKGIAKLYAQNTQNLWQRVRPSSFQLKLDNNTRATRIYTVCLYT